MRFVSLDPESIIIPAKGELHILNRRGIASLRSTNIDRLHAAVQPILANPVDEGELLSAVSEVQRRSLALYLAKLDEVGALRFEVQDEPSPVPKEQNGGSSAPLTPDDLRSPQDLGHRHPHACLNVGARSVFVSLDGAVAGQQGQCEAVIRFVGPNEIRQTLLALDHARGDARRIYVLTQSRSPSFDLDGRAAYARLLLQRIDRLTRQPASFYVYLLDEGTGTISLTLSLEKRTSSALRSVPHQLNLVVPEDVDQAPLAVAAAGHSVFPMRLRGVGLRYSSLAENMVRWLLAKAIVDEHPERIIWLSGFDSLSEAEIAPANNGLPKLPRLFKLRHVARSRLHLGLALLESFAYRRARTGRDRDTRTIDLLEDCPAHPDIEYLTSVLRLRLKTLPARLMETESGLFVCESRGCRAYSFLSQKAIRDALLRVVQHEFYPELDDEPKSIMQYDFSTFSSRTELRNILRDRETRLTRLNGRVDVRLGRIRCWGRTVWAGCIRES